MAKTQGLYSTKDSNFNRKKEQFQAFMMQLISWSVVAAIGAYAIYYYYNYMERPPLYHVETVQPVAAKEYVKHISTAKNNSNDVSHVYDPYKTPYEQ